MPWINKSSIAGFIVGAVASPVIISLFLYFYVQNQFASTTALSPPDLPVEESVSLDWPVNTLEGETLNFARECEGQVVFLNFWAPWCGPCVSEMPSIEKLYGQFQGRVKFACLTREPPDRIKTFQQEKGYTMPLYCYQGNLPDAFNVRGIPATYIISADGKIKLKHLGSADWADDAVVQFLDDLLAPRETPQD